MTPPSAVKGKKLGRPVPVLTLKEQDLDKLRLMAQRPKSSQETALRARILLGCAAGKSPGEIAEDMGTCRATVGKWRSRFCQLGWAGLVDAPRLGTPRRISDAVVEKIITTTLETKPKAQTHWSTRQLARQVGLWAEASFAGDLQAFQRSVLCRKNARHRGAVCEPALTGLGSMRG